MRVLRRWLLIALAAVGGAAVAAWLAPLGWPFELFSHFRPQLAAAAVVLGPTLMALRSPRAALLCAALAAALLAPGARRLLAGQPTPACGDDALVVVTANVEFTNHDTALLLDWLQAHPADVVVLQEVTPSWVSALAKLARYPHQRLLPREDPYGIALLSRWPLDSVQSLDLAGDGIPSLAAVARVHGQPVHVLGLHTRWPVDPGLAQARDRALQRVAAYAREQTTPVLAVGDLNLSPDSPVFERVLIDSGLRDVFAGRGWHPTWMAGFWPLALRIDHQLVSPDLCIEHAEVGPDIGSDHRPVIASYRLPRAPAPRG